MTLIRALKVLRPYVDRARRLGVRGTVRASLARLPVTLYTHERHRWSVIDLTAPRPHLPVPEGFTLRRATGADLDRLRQLDAGFERAADWLAAGHLLWLIQHGERAVFSVWCFIARAPNSAAAHGWMTLPPGIANVDDAVAAPDYRGRGLAPAAYSAAFDELARDYGVDRVLGVMHEGNAANRRATYKAGWRDFAVVDVRKVGVVRRGLNWRNRPDDFSPFMWNRVRVEPASSIGGETATSAAEMFDYLSAAIRRRDSRIYRNSSLR